MSAKQLFVVGVKPAGAVECRIIGPLTPAEARRAAERLLDAADYVEPVRVLAVPRPAPFNEADIAAWLGYGRPA